jgi:hypothetical protein
LRAGPLSDTAVIQNLNANFVNTWILKSLLPRHRDVGPDDTRRLASAVMGAEQSKSPVDCIVLSPGLTLIDVRPVHDLLSGPRRADDIARYSTFLMGALQKAKQ